VLLVHGIRTDGTWYELTRERLRPFFECEEYSYPGYRSSWFGAVRVAVEPWTVFWALLLSLIGWVSAYLLFDRTFPRVVVPASTLLLGLVVARVRAEAQLRRTFEEFAEFYGTSLHRVGKPIHLIAHSLGAYLTASALMKFGGVRFNRIIYCAAVIPRTFDWKTLLAGRRVRHVRNETGLKDLVPLITAILSPVSRKFGAAGLYGFKGPKHVLHTQADQNVRCSDCETESAPVHNIQLPFEHSSYFIGGLQCEDFWLPFLLGYDPAEFRLLMDLCSEIAERDSLGHHEARDEEEAQLLKYEWKWLQGGTLEERGLRVIRRKHAHIPDSLVPLLLAPRVLHAVGLFWRQVALAQAERTKGRYSKSWAVTGMDPMWVFVQALRRVA
jgi:pimeloyl-ACP methyl ester carboxylesterase